MTFQLRQSVQVFFFVTIAFFVALRVVVHPILLSFPGPGIVALCSGGSIVYVSFETGLPVETEDEVETNACPLIAKTLVATTQSHPQAATQIVVAQARPQAILESPQRPSTFSKYAPRAPPPVI